jgi:glycosyltransferase involved in cell wall biosynthesis
MVYSAVVGHFMRMYDYNSAQKVDFWVANSKNVQARIEKYYRKKSTVIYPPVDVEKIIEETKKYKKEEYFLIVSRLVGAKGLEEAAKVAGRLKFKLKIVGEAHGFSDVEKKIKKLSGGYVELLGRVNDKRLYELYGRARGFIALARDEDFGITVVEAQAAGTPVIAFNGGGFKESVVDGKTGFLIDNTDEKTISDAIKRLKEKRWKKEVLQAQARKFSTERFINEIRDFIESKIKK